MPNHSVSPIAGCLLALLSGCATTTRGPQPILSTNGTLLKPADAEHSVLAQFDKAESAAYTVAIASDATDDAKNRSARAMLETGFTLVYANCSDFFVSAGRTQKWLTFTRDSVGALGTIATAALALHNGSKSAVSNVALTTAGIFTGLDVYTKDFLFSAENIDSVRTLVANALNAHRTAVEAIPGNVTYGTVTVALLDHQDICSPPAITALVRAAIKNGAVEASPDPANELSKVNKNRDDKALADLGAFFAIPGAFTMNEAQLTWHLMKDSPSVNDRIQIYKGLSAAGAPDKRLPIDAKGKTSSPSPWSTADRAQLNQILDSFSDVTRSTLDGPLPGAGGAPPPAPKTAPTASAPSLHMTVRVLPRSMQP